MTRGSPRLPSLPPRGDPWHPHDTWQVASSLRGILAERDAALRAASGRERRHTETIQRLEERVKRLSAQMGEMGEEENRVASSTASKATRSMAVTAVTPARQRGAKAAPTPTAAHVPMNSASRAAARASQPSQPPGAEGASRPLHPRVVQAMAQIRELQSELRDATPPKVGARQPASPVPTARAPVLVQPTPAPVISSYARQPPPKQPSPMRAAQDGLHATRNEAGANEAGPGGRRPASAACTSAAAPNPVHPRPASALQSASSSAALAAASSAAFAAAASSAAFAASPTRDRPRPPSSPPRSTAASGGVSGSDAESGPNGSLDRAVVHRSSTNELSSSRGSFEEASDALAARMVSVVSAASGESVGTVTAAACRASPAILDVSAAEAAAVMHRTILHREPATNPPSRHALPLPDFSVDRPSRGSPVRARSPTHPPLRPRRQPHAHPVVYVPVRIAGMAGGRL